MASLSITNHASKTLLNKISRPPRRMMAIYNVSYKPCKFSMKTSLSIKPKKTWNKDNSDKAVPYEKLDSWIRDSVGEIVNNLRKAPLLLRVHDEDDHGNRRVVMMTQKAEQEDWDMIEGMWDKNMSRVPEGVILVEELEFESDESGITRAWGVLVQGRGNNYGPVCYLLKTTSGVESALGLQCTHFCLMEVKDFREVAFSQLKNCWLLQGLGYY